MEVRGHQGGGHRSYQGGDQKTSGWRSQIILGWIPHDVPVAAVLVLVDLVFKFVLT